MGSTLIQLAQGIFWAVVGYAVLYVGIHVVAFLDTRWKAWKAVRDEKVHSERVAKLIRFQNENRLEEYRKYSKKWGIHVAPPRDPALTSTLELVSHLKGINRSVREGRYDELDKQLKEWDDRRREPPRQ